MKTVATWNMKYLVNIVNKIVFTTSLPAVINYMRTLGEKMKVEHDAALSFHCCMYF